MKLLSPLLLFFPLLGQGQEYFRCDHEKLAKIIHSKSRIEKTSGVKYSIKGELQFQIWNTNYFCDSAVFDCNRNELAIYGNVKQVPATELNFPHYDQMIFRLSDSFIYFPGPSR